jgi:hypothetical protein
MIRWIRTSVVALLALAAGLTHAQTCTTTVSAGADLETTVSGMTSGQVLCLNAGTYTANAGGFNPGVFDFGVGVTIRGLGANPAATVLQSNGVQSNYTVNVVNFNGGKNANGLQMINLTIQGSTGGVQIQDFIGSTRLTDIKFKDVVITTTTNAHTHNGFLAIHADRLVHDNVTITADLNAYFLIDVTDSLFMNSTVPSTAQAPAIGVLGGNTLRFVKNTIGQPRLAPATPFSFPALGVAFNNSSDNRFENNTLQGMQLDSINFTVRSALGFGIPDQASLNNYVGKNAITHSAWSVDANNAGSSGIWANCGSHATWMFGNDIQGVGEGALTVFDSRNTMMMGNYAHNNGIVGMYVSGDVGSLQNCTLPAFQAKPTNTYAIGNAVYYNRADAVIIRDADNTYLARNLVSNLNGLNGAAMVNPSPPAGFSLESDSTAGRSTSSGFTLAGNIITDVSHGIWALASVAPFTDLVTNVEVYLNRARNTDFNRYFTSSAQTWDRGPFLGGNWWYDYTPTNNPSNGAQPYPRIQFNSANQFGNVVDHYPYQDESLGRGASMTFQEPRNGASIALNSKRTIRWDAYGCAWVDVLLGGVTLGSNLPNTGYAILNITGPTGSRQFAINCKDFSGNSIGSILGNTVNVNAAGLQLLSPGRDDTFNAGQSVWVAWSNPGFLTSVAVDVSTDGGASWATLTTVSSIASSNPVTSTRVTLPAGTANAMIRVRNGGNTTANCGGAAGNSCDETDGVFAIRAPAGSLDTSTMGAGRLIVMGQSERLKWVSPTNSKLVTVTATIGATSKVLATDLPDRGYFDVIMPDLGVGTMTLTLNFKNNAGGAISTVGPVTAGFTRYPTTMTFAHGLNVSPGTSTTIAATTNSGAAVTLTSTTTGVCTVTGANVVNGVSAGSCILVAQAAATGNFTAATPQILVVTVTASANFARLTNISTRGQVFTGNDVMIAGFIIGGSVSKTVVINVAGPSLVPFGIPNALANPTLTLVRQSDSATLKVNDNWQTQTIPGDVAAIQATGFQPNNTQEPAIIATLPPGAYTAIVSGVGGGTGVGLVGVFEVDHFEVPLNNISTRGQVGTGGNVMIAGFIIGGSSPRRVVVNVAGPYLNNFGLQGVPDPKLTIVRSSDQAVIATNDNWQQQTDPNDVGIISGLGFAPNTLQEPAVVLTLPPGAYTAIVDSVGGFAGVGLVGVFDAP